MNQPTKQNIDEFLNERGLLEQAQRNLEKIARRNAGLVGVRA